MNNKSFPSFRPNHPASSQVIKPVARAEIVVRSGIHELDRLLGGFKAGQLTYIDGDSALIKTIPNQLSVQTYRTFNSDTLYLDGGICADPYAIARYARLLDVDQRAVLGRVHISRAFTVYQLSMMIEQVLEHEIQRYAPRTLIIGRFPALYLDPDVPAAEAQHLLQNNLQKLQQLALSYNLIAVLTNVERRLYSNEIRRQIESQVHQTVRMRYIEPCTYVDAINTHRSITILTGAGGQLQLEHFGMVM